MSKITNIYVLLDTSYWSSRSISKNQELISKITKTLALLPKKTKMHIWGFNDKAIVINPRDRIIPKGNPNLATGLEAIENAILYERKYQDRQTRSVFLLFGGSRVLDGWQRRLDKLFKLKEFAFGHRYVICKSIPEKFALKAYRKFTDSDSKIVAHFSESRLASLISTITAIERRNFKISTANPRFANKFQ